MQDVLIGLRVLADLCLSAILGFAIGFERRKRLKEAGIRTHTIVCIGAALMMVVSKYAFGASADSARVAAQIVSGVGFLGAGMIVYHRNEIHGLTTAAGVWTTAGVGMACGGRLYVVAVGATFMIVLIQCLLHMKIGVLSVKRHIPMEVCFYQRDGADQRIRDVFGVSQFTRFSITRKENQMVVNATVLTNPMFSLEELGKIVQDNDFIISVELCDNY